MSFENLDYKSKYTLVINGSLQNPGCEYTAP